MEFSEVVRRRRMVRRYAERPVEPTVVDRMLEHATHAPSAGFSQGWAFLRAGHARGCGPLLEATTPASAARNAWLDGMRTAPVVLVALSHKDAYLDRYAEPDKGWTDRDEARWPVPYWHTDTAMAALLILLTAVDEGLAACFFGIDTGLRSRPSERPSACRNPTPPSGRSPLAMECRHRLQGLAGTARSCALARDNPPRTLGSNGGMNALERTDPPRNMRHVLRVLVRAFRDLQDAWRSMPFSSATSTAPLGSVDAYYPVQLAASMPHHGQRAIRKSSLARACRPSTEVDTGWRGDLADRVQARAGPAVEVDHPGVAVHPWPTLGADPAATFSSYGFTVFPSSAPGALIRAAAKTARLGASISHGVRLARVTIPASPRSQRRRIEITQRPLTDVGIGSQYPTLVISSAARSSSRFASARSC